MAAPVVTAFFHNSVYAAGFTARKLVLQPGVGGDGGSLAGGTVNHYFDFVAPTAGNVGSITIQYCDTAGPSNALPNCTAPNNGTSFVDTSGVTVTDGVGITGWTSATSQKTDPVNTAANNAVLLANTATPHIGASTEISFTLNGIVNPPTPNTTFFAWIKTFANTTGTGSPIDSGTVAASTANDIYLKGHMPEALTFCTGATVPLTTGAINVPDCTNATSGDIDFDILFDPADTATATSQMAASTNATSGYSISVQGATLTNGTNVINPMIAAGGTAPAPGSRQFGMNLVENTTTKDHITSGTCPDGTTGTYPCNLGLVLGTGYLVGGTYNGLISSPFGTVDKFFFDNTQATVVATSTSTVSDLQTYTASYIANVTGSLPAGDYTTTLTYVCTGQF